VLVFAALGPFRRALVVQSKPLTPLPPWLLGVSGFIAATIWYCHGTAGLRHEAGFPAA